MKPAQQIKRIEQLLGAYRNGIITLEELKQAVEDAVKAPTALTKPLVVCPTQPKLKPITVAAGI